jgi:hypothetical protein
MRTPLHKGRASVYPPDDCNQQNDWHCHSKPASLTNQFTSPNIDGSIPSPKFAARRL